jgi:hypothetical protein
MTVKRSDAINPVSSEGKTSVKHCRARDECGLDDDIEDKHIDIGEIVAGGRVRPGR